MTDTSTMFLNDLSVVDHAYVDAHGNKIGGSFHPCFLVAGKIDPVEKVVVDFSTIKKRMKQMIDDDQLGFDHKCWIIEDVSLATIEIDGERVTDFSLLDSDHFDFKAEVILTTPKLTMKAPKDAFKFVPKIEGCENYSIENAGAWFERYLNELFAPENITVECRNTVNLHTYIPTDQHSAAYFTYAHGLKDSTSWGCQNLGHGHLSFIQVVSNAERDVEDQVVAKIAEDLNYTVFVNSHNIVEDITTDELTAIKYETGRGKFVGIYKTGGDERRMKIRILDTETTIEFLVDYIKDKYADKLSSIGATGIFVSEGLSKGAYVEL